MGTSCCVLGATSRRWVRGPTDPGYLLRAYALQPNDPLLCLLCSVACLSRATNRQVDNRNHTIVQGIALLTQYAQLRSGTAEAEYNFGRAYQHLGSLFNLPRPVPPRHPSLPAGA